MNTFWCLFKGLTTQKVQCNTKKLSDQPFFFFSLNISVFLNHSYLEYNSKCLHKKVVALLINWIGLVSGQCVDRYDLAIPISLFFLCFQNRIVTADIAKTRAVDGPSWVLGYGVLLKHGRHQETWNSHPCHGPIQLECLHSRKGFYSPHNRFI